MKTDHFDYNCTNFCRKLSKILMKTVQNFDYNCAKLRWKSYKISITIAQNFDNNCTRFLLQLHKILTKIAQDFNYNCTKFCNRGTNVSSRPTGRRCTRSHSAQTFVSSATNRESGLTFETFFSLIRLLSGRSRNAFASAANADLRYKNFSFLNGS
jgi:hypothetical protein